MDIKGGNWINEGTVDYYTVLKLEKMFKNKNCSSYIRTHAGPEEVILKWSGHETTVKISKQWHI